ncbi:MAG: hypothetical protein DHS20C14_18450 [Phycisphaeraceae bacterium]|nr:MAG: hypothetical protein DHS20C14_18450 [Phycisphaeraceae bacterium]
MNGQHDDSPTIREPAVTLDDLTRGLIWPMLLRAPALALRPERWLTGVAAVVVLGLIGSISGLWAGDDGRPFMDMISAHLIDPTGAIFESIMPWRWDQWEPQVFLGALGELLLAPARMLDEDPWAVVALGIPMLIVWAVAGVAIGRSAAFEVSLARVVPWPQALGFALRRWLSGFGAIAAPLLLIAVIHLLIAVGGFVLFTWPGGDVVGAVVHVLGMAAALVAVLVGVGYLLGWSMLVPALACEGTDALDAIQRVYAYVIGRPLRLLVYLFLAGLVGLVAFVVIVFVRELAVGMADGAAAQWSGERGTTILARTPDTGGTMGAAIWVLGIWRALLDVLVAGFVVSYVHTAGTLIYLMCRRVNDGQEIAELWTGEDGR